MKYMHYIFSSHEIMLNCWAESPVTRPTFTNLVQIFDSILTNLLPSVSIGFDIVEYMLLWIRLQAQAITFLD